jgi:gluconolactonase
MSLWSSTLSLVSLFFVLSAQSAIGQGVMFEAGAKLKVESSEGSGGEGPAWHPTQGVFTSGNGNIHRLDASGTSSVFLPDSGTNGLLLDRQGKLVCCDQKLRRVVRRDMQGQVEVLAETFDGKRFNTPNDLTIDSKNRIYFSDPRYGDRDSIEMKDANGKAFEGVYRIDTDGSVTRVIGREVERANGVLVDAKDQFLFVADNNNNTSGGARKLWRFPLKPDGTVDSTQGRAIYDWKQGRGPDGLKQDVEGNLYVAAGLNRKNPPYEPDDSIRAGIYVMDTEGKLLDFVPVPTDEVTNCAFGGEDRKTLYITGGGTLYSIRTKNAGRLVWPTR